MWKKTGGEPMSRSGGRFRSPGETGAIVLLTSISAMFLATSSAPTPLYEVYADRWGVSPAETSVVFGAYALSLLAALVVTGRLSDHVGRLVVIRCALAVQVAAMLVFALADGVPGLLVARVLQGLSTGAGLSAVGAALLDVHPKRGRVANSAAPPLGSAFGALGAAVLVAYAPQPTRLVYVVFAVLILLQTAAVVRLPETAPRIPGAAASLRPGVRVPRPVLLPLGAALPVLFSVWALSGLFGAFGPRLATALTGSPSPLLGAAPIAVVGLVAPAVAISSRGVEGRPALAWGIAGLLAAAALTATAVLTGSIWLLVVASAVAGSGFGFGFQGGMRLVLTATGENDRAGVLSVLYTASYLGFGGPAIALGIVFQQTGDLTGTTVGYTVFLAVLAAAAATALHRVGSDERTQS
ncbi:MFS transporter [Streptomyces sp. NPDC049936]|uniref:MFS transporter n=1 Tax=Streptomyces sp. NPDC049936 TaxID=3365599 RepID=UPI0037B5A0E9